MYLLRIYDLHEHNYFEAVFENDRLSFSECLHHFLQPGLELQLSMCDFYSWGYFKANAYKGKSQTLEYQKLQLKI